MQSKKYCFNGTVFGEFARAGEFCLGFFRGDGVSKLPVVQINFKYHARLPPIFFPCEFYFDFTDPRGTGPAAIIDKLDTHRVVPVRECWNWEWCTGYQQQQGLDVSMYVVKTMCVVMAHRAPSKTMAWGDMRLWSRTTLRASMHHSEISNMLAFSRKHRQTEEKPARVYL